MVGRALSESAMGERGDADLPEGQGKRADVEPALSELEHLLLRERVQDAARRVRRIVDTELGDEPIQSVPLSGGASRHAPGQEAAAVGSRFGCTRLWPVVSVQANKRRSTGADLRSTLLLAAEAIAVIGFVLVLAVYYVRLQDLNVEYRNAQVQAARRQEPVEVETAIPGAAQAASLEAPTATWTAVPTPMASVNSVVTEPSVAPAATGHAVGELVMASATSTHTVAASATPTARSGMWLLIPSLGVDAPIVEGDDREALSQGVGHRIGTAEPGQPGNCVLSAHNDIHGAWFRDLDELEFGDLVEVHTPDGVFVYSVESTRFVAPDAIEVLAPTQDAVVTLISCYPYLLDTQRIVVVAGFLAANPM